MNNKVKLPSCVIMAGGRGVRLGAITKNTPKPILKIYNKPYLSYLIQWLSKNGFKKFIFLLSYKHQKIEIFLKEYFADKNLNYKIFIDKKRSGTFAALKNHLNKMDNFFFYTNADEISDFNIKKLFIDFKNSKTKIMCGLLKTNKGKYSIDKKNNQIKIIEKSKKNLYKDCGYKFINKSIFYCAKKKYKKLEDFIYLEYLKRNKVSFFLVKKKPLRIDTAKDIKITKKYLNNVK